ncbi:hypothetical protein GCM10023189_52040 [Nibrella saemangeumensis]|uniref:Uncharacterized protein n=1 Tax=Nibrella saemangeumensis TaxID=1084526 RepID=A0ABP8NIU3_9BACT
MYFYQNDERYVITINLVNLILTISSLKISKEKSANIAFLFIKTERLVINSQS